jgi:hypothetical protein
LGHVRIPHTDLSRVLQGTSRRDAKPPSGWLLNMRKGIPARCQTDGRLELR